MVKRCRQRYSEISTDYDIMAEDLLVFSFLNGLPS